jgi:hypothetical protein
VLTITVKGEEFWDEESEKFVNPNAFELQLEHSLVSLSKWESEFKKPFLGPGEKTNDEALAYIHHMIVGVYLPREALNYLSEDNVEAIREYMAAELTATWFHEIQPEAKSGETITSELIYYWMTAFQIDFQPAETWHLSRLFTLIRIANVKNSKPKPMSKAEVYARNKRLNAERRKQLGTSG